MMPDTFIANIAGVSWHFTQLFELPQVTKLKDAPLEEPLVHPGI